MNRGAWQATVHDISESDTTEPTHTPVLFSKDDFYDFWQYNVVY